MKSYIPYMTLGLFALLEPMGCAGNVLTPAPADSGITDGASTGGDSASRPDTATGDSATRSDTVTGDETPPSPDAMQPQPATDATLAEAGIEDATLPSTDATAVPDGPSAEDSPSSADSAVNEGDSAVGEGGSCEDFTTGDPTCDQCVVTNCCAAAAACNAGEDTGADDGGGTACEQIVSCIEDACAEGGVFGECVVGCSPDEVSPADALLTCVAASCSAECN
ncbi:MAG TPA: hypothetical protein VK841_11355 [Polyangiaceae bacterium]|jgi:hypothetical protein|nr:hypothetical protein [Polyangiaceae bacterium]